MSCFNHATSPTNQEPAKPKPHRTSASQKGGRVRRVHVGKAPNNGKSSFFSFSSLIPYLPLPPSPPALLFLLVLLLVLLLLFLVVLLLLLGLLLVLFLVFLQHFLLLCLGFLE